VVGLADERWGKIVSAFVKRRSPVAADDLDQFCRASGSQISSGRVAMSSSRRSPNRRSASSCAASWWRAITNLRALWRFPRN
jgi:hypothetical protein